VPCSQRRAALFVTLKPNLKHFFDSPFFSVMFFDETRAFQKDAPPRELSKNGMGVNFCKY
jgi:hypothetical protein